MKLLPLITISVYVLEKDCPRTNDDATSRLVDDVSQKWFNQSELENGNDCQNLKEATGNAFKIFAIVLRAFEWLACFKYVIANHSNAITLNEHDIHIFNVLQRLSVVEMFQCVY